MTYDPKKFDPTKFDPTKYSFNLPLDLSSSSNSTGSGLDYTVNDPISNSTNSSRTRYV